MPRKMRYSLREFRKVDVSFNDLSLLETLVDFDGPLVAVVACRSKRLLAVWVDCSASANRWMLLDAGFLSQEEPGWLADLRAGVVALRDVVEGCSTVYLVDDSGYNASAVHTYLLPKSYLPVPGVTLGGAEINAGSV